MPVRCSTNCAPCSGSRIRLLPGLPDLWRCLPRRRPASWAWTGPFLRTKTVFCISTEFLPAIVLKGPDTDYLAFNLYVVPNLARSVTIYLLFGFQLITEPVEFARDTHLPGSNTNEIQCFNVCIGMGVGGNK